MDLCLKDIATKIGNMKASRAVGKANNKIKFNYCPLSSRCGKNGKLAV